jgi:hypothetical protein
VPCVVPIIDLQTRKTTLLNFNALEESRESAINETESAINETKSIINETDEIEG